MNHPYKTRVGGATVTVFVPYDCGNNCPFCINKSEYANMDGFSVEKICESIRTMDAITPNCDVVFTGGEPLAKLDVLQQMLDCIPATHKIYINTTVPVFSGRSEDEIVEFIHHNREKITCINVSRHMQKYVEESEDALLYRLAVPVRINCVLYKHYPKEQLIPYVERFLGHPVSIQFRFDYTATTPENLYDEEQDGILRDLKGFARFTGLDGCRMRCGFHFDYKGMELTYHKTLPYSTIVERDGETDYAVLYDILIKQNGDIHADWDGTALDTVRYRQASYEPYDLRWLKGEPQR